MIYTLHFQELPDQEVNKDSTPLFSLPTYGPGNQFLRNCSPQELCSLLCRVPWSCHSEVTCIKLSSVYVYHLRDFFFRKKRECHNVEGEKL